MKKIILIALAVVAVIGSLLVYQAQERARVDQEHAQQVEAQLQIQVQRDQDRTKQSQAISAVFQRKRDAQSQARMLLNGRQFMLDGEPAISEKKYLLALDKISTADCPESFRIAWLNYIQALKRQRSPGDVAIVLMEVGISLKTPLAKDGLGKDAVGKLDKLNSTEAWMQVETAALEYGVQYLPDKLPH
jgi:Ni/Co efflux regulator RcnB